MYLMVLLYFKMTPGAQMPQSLINFKLLVWFHINENVYNPQRYSLQYYKSVCDDNLGTFRSEFFGKSSMPETEHMKLRPVM